MLRFKSGLQKMLSYNRGGLSHLMTNQRCGFSWDNNNNDASGNGENRGPKSDMFTRKRTFARSERSYPGTSSHDQRQSSRATDQQAHRKKSTNLDQAFITRYGKTKSELLDSWLEMDGGDLAKECQRMGVTPSDKHIENIQSLFEQLKKIEAEIEKASPAYTQAEGNESNDVPSYQSQPQISTPRSQSDVMFKKPRLDRTSPLPTEKPSFQSKSETTKNFALDQEKARENLNEQLARILNKRKIKYTEEEAKPRLFGNQGNQRESQEPLKEQSTEIVNPFSFSLSSLKKSLQERGPLTGEVNPVVTQFPYSHSDSGIIDRIFEMTTTQLDTHFRSYDKSSILASMDLKQEDFEKLPSITKKKVLINMTGVRQTIPSNPNTGLGEGDFRNLKHLVSFARENKYFLNESSKNIISEQLHNIVSRQDGILKASLLGNPQLHKDLITIAEDILPKDQLNQLIQNLVKFQLNENDSIYSDVQLDDAVNHASIVHNLTEYQQKEHPTSTVTTLQQLQNNFYNGVRKLFSKKSVKNLSFDEMLTVLKALPPVEGDLHSTTKSLHYILLNEMLSPSSSLVERWEALDKSSIFEIVERCRQMSKCRDLSNKLRGCLLHIQTHTFSLDDFHNLFKLLAEHGYLSNQGTVDIKLVQNLLLRRNIKTAANLANSSDPKELRKFFDFYEFLYKHNPVIFAYVPAELKTILSRATQVALEQHMPLQEMVMFAKTMIPSLFKPVLFFTEMITDTKESFKTDVDQQNLYEFVTQIIQRASDGEVGFDHLQLSTSRVHRNYRPFTEKTIFLLQRIISDLIEGPTISEPQLRVITKILSNSQISNHLFKSSAQVDTQLAPVLEALHTQMEAKNEEILAKPQVFNTQELTFNIDYDSWREQFKALSTIAHLSDSFTSSKPQASSQKNKTDSESPLKEQLLSKVIPSAFNLLKNELYRTTSFQQQTGTNTVSHPSPIDNLFKLNKSILEFFDQAGFMEQQYQESQVRELVAAVMESHFLNKKPLILSFEKFKRNVKISKMIQSDTNKALILNNAKEIIHFMNYAQIEGCKEIAKNLCHLIMPQSRSYAGKDLVNLFKMIDKQAITDDVRALIVNMAPNLMTIEAPKIFDYSSKFNGDYDARFTNINERLEKVTLADKLMILKKYEHIYHQEPELLKKPGASLSPLSYLMAEVFDKYTDAEVLMCLEMLGNDKVENYHESFIKALYERYSARNVIENMIANNQKFFLKFSKHWPHFLKNNEMLNQLITLGKQGSTLAKQQSEILQILTRKNVLHPELLEMHLETFMKMKDRERVSIYLKEFLHSAAFLGYTNITAVDMHKITQLFRRLYKTPDMIPQIEQLLNYLVVLALQNTYYKDFDAKSVEFVESAITFIENTFTGQSSIEVGVPNPLTGQVDEGAEKVKLNYYKSIPSNSKIYNKVLIKNNFHNKSFNFKKAWSEIEFESGTSKDEVAALNEDENNVEEEEDEEVDPEAAKPVPISDKHKKGTKKEPIELAAIDPVEEEIDLDLLPTQDFIMKEDEMDQRLEKSEVVEESKHYGQRDGKKKEKKIYERKASESLYSEELEFHQFRKKRLQDLDKKSKHLLLFSNINQLNFADVNQSDVVKAWAVLFHFRSKTFESTLYDEFESLTMRNAIGKSKGHELFSKFYLKLIESSYDKGFRMHLTTKCEKTGWPIDISISGSEKSRKKLALYFFLQEEVCLNAKEQSEEPLGVQKVMLKHLQSISDYKVEYVTENDFYMNKDSIDSYVEYLLNEKLLVTSNRSSQQTFESEA